MDTQIEQPRNDAGQFTSSEDQFGIKGVEIGQGYIPRPDPVKADAAPADEPEEYDINDEEQLRELAAKKYGSEAELTKVEIFAADGSKAPDNLAQTVEQAANDLAHVHRAGAEEIEQAHLDRLAKEVDEARAERIKGDPKTAEHYGLDAAEVEANAKAAKDVSTSEEPSQSVETTVDGLDPEVAKALKLPQVRQAIEQELAQVDEAKQTYSKALNTAHLVSQEMIVELLPELRSFSQEHWADAIMALHQSDPARVSRAMGILERGAQIETAQADWQRYQAHEQRQQFENYAKAEDQRFEQMPEWAQLGKAEQAKVSGAVVEYAGELGIDQQTLVNLMQTNPIMRNAAFQKMMVDAAQYRMLRKAPPKAIPKAIPAVQKPGVAAPRGQASAQNIQALTSKLASSGSVEDAYALYQAKRRSKG
ncbi:hypothetical protein [Bradyrhizobium zhanjiangense]|uniref:Uncharacterized protein n=1 Tax=Bradyrhizobium zhanjiangense TaxID=1325107 RepID=A0A4Q0Q7Z7_9BRAD|nr:hypothetical protein [Bradyrhizobium zhanjiangense]RXG85345.1 hypothetical protein EAS61_36455 [Bradyrhizobium zhanjiangense]